VPLVIAAGAALFWLTFIARDALSKELSAGTTAH
jgi:hypothetical protein